MTVEEKIALLSGPITLEMMQQAKQDGYHFNFFPFPAGGNSRLGIPMLQFADGPRGVTCGEGLSTCFPVPSCRAAAFDEKLEEKIGHAMGREARAYGANVFGGICLNLPYHPGWGRAQETYGEDSFLIGSLGSALVKGIRAEHVIPCIKHFAFNSMENMRFEVDIDCDERTEREVFLPHFKRCVDGGALCVMTAYNRFRGEYCGNQKHLIRDVLKGEWKFSGFTMGDFYWGLHDTVRSMRAGLDVEMTSPVYYGEKLIKAVENGTVPEAWLDEAAERVASTVCMVEEEWQEACVKGEVSWEKRPPLPVPLRLNQTPVYDRKILGCEEHQKLALEAAREGITLIKNEGAVLPLNKACHRIAVIGDAALRRNTGDHGSSRVYPEKVISLLEGMREAVPDAELIYYSGENPEHARMLAKRCDAVVVAAGLDFQDEGEYNPISTDVYSRGRRGGDRTDLRLHEEDEALLKEVGGVNPATVAVIFAGSTILMEEWEQSIPAILMAYYPGQMGGRALGEILFGKISPSGKLPFVIPKKAEDLPAIDWGAKRQHYDYLHGFSYLMEHETEPYRPFGFGLTYTTFQMADPLFEKNGKQIKVSVTLKNTGRVSGVQVLQVYGGTENAELFHPKRVLMGFQRVKVSAGKEKRVTIRCSTEPLKYYDADTGTFRMEACDYRIYVGFSSAEKDLQSGLLQLSS